MFGRRVLFATALTAVLLAALLPGGIAAADVSGLKAPLAGVADRKGIPTSAYQPVVQAVVVQVPWSSLQAAPGADITDSAPTDPTTGNAIDTAIGYARSHPELHVRLKLRVLAGINAPDWAKNLPVTTGAPGPFSLCDTSSTPTQCGTVGHFWELDYRQAYADLQAKLAAKYDSEPAVADVAITGCSTVTGEPLLRQASYAPNLGAYSAAGYDETANAACERDQIDAHRVWQLTRSSLAFNPYQRWDATAKKFATDESFTESLISYCRGALGSSCVVGNNSIGKKQAVYPCADLTASDWLTRDVNARMYTTLSCTGAPIYFQTASGPKLAAAGTTLSGTLDFALTLGAGLVELPMGYSDPSQTAIYLPPAQLACYDSALAGTGGCPPPDTPPSAPTGLTANASTTSQGTLALSWAASTDDKGVASYAVRRDGVAIATTTGTPYTDTNVSIGGHTYVVAATDTAGQVSADSGSAAVTVPDVTAPSAPTGLAGRAVTSIRVDLTWIAATDNVAVTGYRILRGGVVIGTGPTPAFSDRTVKRGHSYSYTVQAVDAANNVGAASTSTTVAIR